MSLSHGHDILLRSKCLPTYGTCRHMSVHPDISRVPPVANAPRRMRRPRRAQAVRFTVSRVLSSLVGLASLYVSATFHCPGAVRVVVWLFGRLHNVGIGRGHAYVPAAGLGRRQSAGPRRAHEAVVSVPGEPSVTRSASGPVGWGLCHLSRGNRAGSPPPLFPPNRETRPHLHTAQLTGLYRSHLYTFILVHIHILG